MVEWFGKDLRRMMNKPYGYMPPKGYVWNPLRAYPRNLFCPCRSMKKFKKCCLPKMPATVKAEDEKVLKEAVQKALKIHLTR